MSKYSVENLRDRFRRGENLMGYLRDAEAQGDNSPTTILYSYDVQAGSYTALLDDPAFAAGKRAVGEALAGIIAGFAPASLLDAGTGEGTTLAPVLRAMSVPPAEVLAFDISVSRLLHARRHLATKELSATLFTSELERIPLEDGSVDVVTTYHAIEPNRGRETPILAELLRVARKGVVLVEPSYEFGGASTRERMDRLGYVRGLPDAIRALGHDVKVEAFPINQNPSNEAALLVVTKDAGALRADGEGRTFLSPLSGAPLVRRSDCFFCERDGHAYPVIGGIPCLTVDAAVLASHLDRV